MNNIITLILILYLSFFDSKFMSVNKDINQQEKYEISLSINLDNAGSNIIKTNKVFFNQPYITIYYKGYSYMIPYSKVNYIKVVVQD